jgi:hypothetical protein
MLRRERSDQRAAKMRKLSSEGEERTVVALYHWTTDRFVLVVMMFRHGVGDGCLPKDERANTTRAKTPWMTRRSTVRLMPTFGTILANMEIIDMAMHSTEVEKQRDRK